MAGGDDDMDTTGAGELNVRRGRRRTGINIAAPTMITAATMIAAGAVLVGISVSQHQHHDHLLAVQAARRAQVDRAAAAEAQQLHAAALVLAAAHHAVPGPASQQSSPARQLALGATKPGAVSVIRGAGAALVIPALRVHAPVVATGAVDGSMTIPADVHIVGWYNGTDNYQGTTYSFRAPWPGQPGVSVLAGHINWVGQGPGALYYIGQLVVGDPVEVVGSNGVATYWRVSQPPVTLPKSALPASLFVSTGPPRLALVTCGGPYDSATGHYLDNVIVWATLTAR